MALLGAWLQAAPGRAAEPAIRLYPGYAATDPGTDAFAASLARGGGLRAAGLPAFEAGVVTTEADRLALWITGLDRSARLRARPGQVPFTDDTAGFAAGLDRRFGDDAIAGISVDHTDTNWDSGPQKGAASTTGLGAYGAAAWGTILYGTGAIQYDFGSAAVGHCASGTLRAGGAVGHFIDLSGFTFNPLVEVEYSHTSGDASGSTAHEPGVSGQDGLVVRAGLHISSAFFRWGILGSPHVSLLWEERLRAPDQNVPVAHEGSSGVVGGGVVVSLPAGLFAGVDASTHFASRLDERTVRLSLTKAF